MLEIQQTLRRMVGMLDELMRPDGYNIGLNLGRAAGAGLPGHLHWHIVPRWNGDTNFMPVLADVKVIVQSLDSLGASNRGTEIDGADPVHLPDGAECTVRVSKG